MDERNVDEPVIGGAPNLDDMLGNLQVYNQSHNKIIKIEKKKSWKDMDVLKTSLF